MTDQLRPEYLRNKGLLPFQDQFVREFLSSNSSPHWELVSPVGTGKKRMAGALVAQIASGPVANRILVLTPAGHLMEWTYELKAASDRLNILTVDRRYYMELEANVPVGVSPWPVPAVVTMSIDLAKREDMAASLSSVFWDLVIVDESHMLVGQRRMLLQALIDSKKAIRTLLLTATPSPEMLSGVSRRVVQRSEVVDWNGHPLFPVSEQKIHSLTYSRAEDERLFLNRLQEFCNWAVRSTALIQFQKLMLLRIASSCMFALEASLRRLHESWRHARNRAVHGLGLQVSYMPAEEQIWPLSADELEGETSPKSAPPSTGDFLALFNELEQLLDVLDEVSSDTKLDCLIRHLNETYGSAALPFVCISTSFSQTARYLCSSLEQRSISAHCITGETVAEQQYQVAQAFREKGGMLIVTDVVSGMAMEFVDECINYDLPLNQMGLEQRRGMFDRLGRTRPFRMTILRDESRTLVEVEDMVDTILQKME